VRFELEITARYRYDGKIENFTYGSGSPLAETRTYDQYTLLPTGVHVANGATNVLQLGFGYAAIPTNNGNIVSQTISAPVPDLPATLTQTYQYDQVNRIISLFETGGSPILSQTYAYDAFGNMANTAGQLNTQPSHTPTAISGFLAANGMSYNQWVTACTTPPSCYDDGGNQVAVSGDVYAYDAENRMTSANAQNMGATAYAYDEEGRRVWKTAAGASTVYSYDEAGELIAEYSTGTPATFGTQYLSADQIGTTRLITNNTGAVIERFDYVPFGQEIPARVDGRGPDYESGVFPNIPDVQSLKFTGKERDAETGLDYFGARYFSGAQGRFTSPDWSAKPEPVPYANLEDPQTLNLYGYVRNNPLKNRDLDGHICIFGFGRTCVSSPPAPAPPQTPLLTGSGQLAAGPQQATSSQGTTAAQSGTTKGGGFGMTVGATAALGVGKAGAAATGSATAAGFVSSNGSVSGGVSASGGAMATAGKTAVGVPSQSSDSTAVGAFAGAGVGFVFTNAGSNQTLASTTTVLSFDIAFEVGGSIQLALGPQGVNALSISVGPGFGLAYTQIDTATKATGK
jgi:RHS repeat-associated protein